MIVRPHLSHPAQEANGIPESFEAPQHHKRLLLQFPLVMLSGREHQARTRGGCVVHDQRLKL